MKRNLSYNGLSLLIATAALSNAVAPAQAQESPTPSSGAAGKKPNILFIMGDDLGWFNVGPYNRGIMFKI
jgi:arylsulfatase